MYHYETCGLNDIYLRNGFTEMRTRHGLAVSIHNVEGLHKVIGSHIAANPEKLSGKELRFLRKEMDFTQKSLADILDCTRQTVIAWESETDPVPTLVGVTIKRLYQEKMNGGITELSQMLGEIADLDRQLHDLQRSEFEETPNGDWVEIETIAV